MKVEKIKKEFEPVVITLESEIDIDRLKDGLRVARFYDQCLRDYQAKTENFIAEIERGIK